MRTQLNLEAFPRRRVLITEAPKAPARGRVLVKDAGAKPTPQMLVKAEEPEVTAWVEDGSSPPHRGWWEIKQPGNPFGLILRAWYEPEDGTWSQGPLHYVVSVNPFVWRGLAKPPAEYPTPYELT